MISNNDLVEVQLTTNGIPIRNIWYMLLYAWKSWHLKEKWNTEIEHAPNIDCLLVSVLLERILQRIRIGLGRDYKKIENEIYGLRGRIDFNKSIKSISFPQGCTYSRYQIYTKNVLKNQIIRSTLSLMIMVGDFGPDKIKAKNQCNKLRGVVQSLQGVDIVNLKPVEILREQLKQKDAEYRLMLSLCYFLYLRLMPMEQRGRYSFVKVRRDNETLYDIYEKFVAEFYRYHLKEWDVRPQSILNWPSDKPSDFLPVMKPDLILEHKKTKQIIILDTKFTKDSIVEGRWGNLTFNQDHMYQIYSYLKSQEHMSEQYRKSTGVLLYPTTNEYLPQTIDLQGHKIRLESVNLAQPWQKIEEDLLSLIKKSQES